MTGKSCLLVLASKKGKTKTKDEATDEPKKEKPEKAAKPARIATPARSDAAYSGEQSVAAGKDKKEEKSK